jgi:hypothetical protein
MPIIKVSLHPVKHNFRTVIRAVKNCKIRRENKVAIVEIKIGSQTIRVEVPP